jgi:hypothetical protein
MFKDGNTCSLAGSEGRSPPDGSDQSPWMASQVTAFKLQSGVVLKRSLSHLRDIPLQCLAASWGDRLGRIVGALNRTAFRFEENKHAIDAPSGRCRHAAAAPSFGG